LIKAFGSGDKRVH